MKKDRRVGMQKYSISTRYPGHPSVRQGLQGSPTPADRRFGLGLRKQDLGLETEPNAAEKSRVAGFFSVSSFGLAFLRAGLLFLVFLPRY